MRETVVKLRELMAEEIDAIIIPSSDPHYSEYVSSHFKTREFISGFTGSAGTVVIMKESAGLWTDGRYYTQADIELKDSGIDLFKASELDVKAYDEYLLENLKEESVVAINGDYFSASEVKKMKEKFNEKKIELRTDVDYPNQIWSNRPWIRESEVFSLKDKYQGGAISEKLTLLRSSLKENKVDGFVVSNLDSVAWLFNIRANDIDYFPVVYAYGFVTLDKCYLFVDKKRVSARTRDLLVKENVEVLEYCDIENFFASFDKKIKVGCNLKTLNFNLYNVIEQNKQLTVSDAIEFVDELKSIKNQAEIKNMKKAYLHDCAALAEFWSKLFTDYQEGCTYSEHQLVGVLRDTRKRNKDCLGESFGAIVAYNENAAMMHYAPSQKQSSIVKAEGTLLVDSGGQYQFGTTDITRTFALGEVSAQVRDDFTLALKGIIALQDAIFHKGSTAADLDVLCRQYLWKKGIDYKCGTGHGVGYVSTVHEGSVNFRYNTRQKHILPGMILTVEPGVYREGVHGIRTENTVVVKEAFTTEFGVYFALENICFFPIDKTLINKELLSIDEINWINDYHREVFGKLEKMVSDSARIWLEEKCGRL